MDIDEDVFRFPGQFLIASFRESVCHQITHMQPIFTMKSIAPKVPARSGQLKFVNCLPSFVKRQKPSQNYTSHDGIL